MRRIHTSPYKLKYSQNFLKPLTAKRLVSQMQLSASDTVIEIGPGTGVLTEHLLAKAKLVIAVEKDPVLCAKLITRFGEAVNFVCINSDFLKWDLPLGKYKVVGNIPFAHTAEILRKLVRHQSPPQSSYVIVQREAAQKFTGVPKEGLTSLLWKPEFEIKLLSSISRNEFVPQPQVDAALLQVSLRSEPMLHEGELSAYKALLIQVFTGHQSTVLKELKKLYGWQKVRKLVGLDLYRRKSEFSFEEWVELSRRLEILNTKY